MKFTLKQVFWFSALVWSAFVIISTQVDPEIVFHVINPLSIALGFVLIMVYGTGIKDAFTHSKEPISLAHLLTFGVVLNWVGMIIRMAQWYVTGKHPSMTFDIEFWFYNFGLWVSIWAGLFLLGAAKLATTTYRPGTLTVLFLVIFGFLVYWGYSDTLIIRDLLGFPVDLPMHQ